MVAPIVGAWIEILSHTPINFSTPSLLSWERGLKYACRLANVCVTWSLLSWERGLKSSGDELPPGLYGVAPIVGAWIEILYRQTLPVRA